MPPDIAENYFGAVSFTNFGQITLNPPQAIPKMNLAIAKTATLPKQPGID